MKRTILTLAVAALAVAGLTACDPTIAPDVVQPTVSPDTLFLGQLDQAGVPAPGQAHIDVAHSMCDALDAGATMQQVFLTALGSSPLTPEQTGTLIGAGIVAYCPEYVDDIDSVGDPA